ncbi:MAG TPA: choice-of-anchor Q domain-containing protein [Bacteroidia bacterium]|nr:choice-of-anchor Q domain-containing protein [Bacteroidia bacterium]
MRNFKFILSLSLLFIAAFTSCRKDPLDEDTDAQLLFSSDTIVFDTVFTTIGSATRHFKVYNTSSKSVRISSVQLAGGSASAFHLNVDGAPVVSTGDIILRGGDSMYVFVDVTIDPNNSNSPLMVEDSILFVTNGNLQRVILNAVGQDAYFHYYEYLACNETWTNDKPHVIYGYAVVPSCCNLTINPGTRVHAHKNSVLAVDSCATLRVLGTVADPVTFQGDRLEPDYAEEPGQWYGIWLSGGSRDNVIDWAVIKNATIGVRVDTLGTSANPTLRITNTKLRNMTFAGIAGIAGAWIEGENLAITNCGQFCAALLYGGRYKFTHCTFGNYWDIDTRTAPAVLLNNWYEVDDFTNEYRDLTQADFFNCIIYGTQENEIGLDSNGTGQFNFLFRGCLIRTNVNVSNSSNFQINLYNADPSFVDVINHNVHLNAVSPAIDSGDSSNSLPADLDNFPRPVGALPDIGCYEWH